jgi:hypothetical protein
MPRTGKTRETAPLSQVEPGYNQDCRKLIEVKPMRKWLLSGIFCGLLAAPAFAAKGPEIELVDNKLSIDAETVPLSRLLRLLDMATGLKSKVPPELANRNISVKFSGLDLTEGVRKIFQGQPVDYAFIEGQGVIVTAPSQNLTGTETVPPNNAGPSQPEQPLVQEFQQQQSLPPGGFQPGIQQQQLQQQQLQQQQQQQPATIQTPFGPLPNPRANQQQLPNTPISAPGQVNQANTLFPNSAPQNQAQPGGQTNTPFQNTFPQNQAQPAAPNGQPVNSTPSSPFGTQTPFGAQPQSNPPNSLFGSQPPTFNNPGNR